MNHQPGHHQSCTEYFWNSPTLSFKSLCSFYLQTCKQSSIKYAMNPNSSKAKGAHHWAQLDDFATSVILPQLDTTDCIQSCLAKYNTIANRGHAQAAPIPFPSIKQATPLKVLPQSVATTMQNNAHHRLVYHHAEMPKWTAGFAHRHKYDLLPLILHSFPLSLFSHVCYSPHKSRPYAIHKLVRD